MSGTASAFDDAHANRLDRWSEFKGAPLVHGGADSTLNFELETNWMLAVENYCEPYHLPWGHPGLSSYSKIEDHYNINDWGTLSGQGNTVCAPNLVEGSSVTFPNLQGLSEKRDTGAEYVARYPNVLLGVLKDRAFAILILPDGSHRRTERVELFYFDEACDSPSGAGYSHTVFPSLGCQQVPNKEKRPGNRRLNRVAE